MSETGVSVAFTVRAMDAGPVLAQERVGVDAEVQAPELLQDLFSRGTRCATLWRNPSSPDPAPGLTRLLALMQRSGKQVLRRPDHLHV